MKTAGLVRLSFLAGAAVALAMVAVEAGAQPYQFVTITPCRQYDSRNFTPLPQNTSRAVLMTGAPCGVPYLRSLRSACITYGRRGEH